MRVMVAMSGGVDSSVAAALLAGEGHEVVGVTMRLWGGESDTGCCSVSDVDDARRVAQQLDIDHLVFNFTDDFDEAVVQPYVDAHAVGVTPNPCIECNRRVKFARLAERAELLGFDAVATGHHARVARTGGRWSLERGADRAKDQSYVVHMLGQADLARTLFPVGRFADKAELRALAASLGLRTAAKPDSQDVCFITSTGGRHDFLRRRLDLHPAEVVDTDGTRVGLVAAVELVTVGQRRGLGLPGGGPKRFVLSVDRASSTVVVGPESALLDASAEVDDLTWVDGAVDGDVLVQSSAHGTPRAATLEPDAGGGLVVRWRQPERRVAARAEHGLLRLVRPPRARRRHRHVTTLRGAAVTLRTASGADVEALVAIRSTAEVRARWDAEIAEDTDAAITAALADPELHVMVVELDGVVVGSIQWAEAPDPMYRHANMDIFLDPAVHGRGIGTDAVRTLTRHLVRDRGHHRLVVDPAADNVAAIRCYAKVGFRAVGVMRQYEQGPDGTWHDGLLMDLVAEDLIL